MEFKTKQEEAQSYRKAGFSYYQIADLMGVSTKQVWTYLKSGEGMELNGDVIHEAVDKVGLPRGSERIKTNIKKHV